MADQSTADDVLTVTNITSLSELQASQFLKRYGSVQTAVNKFFDHGPELPIESQWGGADTSWDEGHFHADKTEEYGPENRPQNSFQVHSHETLNPGVFESLSRPPSRVSLNGSNTAHKHPSDDEQMQQALSMSMDRAQNTQESGVIDISGAQFGPARQGYHYDNHQWGITLAGTQQILPNPEPEFRKREPGVPAFMKPIPTDHYLPALLTILHAIPMAKEALLTRGCELSDYGQSDEWWDGMPIETPRIVSLDQTGLNYTGDILFETQRIMAFLEMTERAYGNTGALSTLGNLADHLGSTNSSEEGLYLDCWNEAVRNHLPDFPLLETFQTSCMAQNLSSLSEGPDITLNSVIATDVHHRLGETVSLYDVMDRALWGTYSQDDSDVSYMEFGEVLVFKLEAAASSISGVGSVGSGVGVKVPPVWYGDRYQKQSVDVAKEMRGEKARLGVTMQKTDERQAKLTTVEDPTNLAKKIEASQLLEVAQPFFEAAATKPSDGRDQTDAEYATDISNQDLGSFSKIAAEFQAVADQVTERFKALEERKDQVLQKTRDVSRLYTKPAEQDGQPPHHRFTLRGVATDSSTTYVLANPNTVEDLIDTDQADWQWWKLSYSSGDARPVSSSKVTEIEVLHASKNGSQKLLLVYASDTAMKYESQKLSGPLRNFVRADNLAFTKELDGNQVPPSPTFKRKADDSDSNEPNWGGSPVRTGGLVDLHTSDSTTSIRQLGSSPPTVPPRMTAGPNPIHQQPVWTDPEPFEIHIEDEEPPNDFQDIDLLTDDDIGPEMQERKGRFGVVPGGTGLGVGEHAHGSYVSELCMQDVEEIEAENTTGKKK